MLKEVMALATSPSCKCQLTSSKLCSRWIRWCAKWSSYLVSRTYYTYILWCGQRESQAHPFWRVTTTCISGTIVIHKRGWSLTTQTRICSSLSLFGFQMGGSFGLGMMIFGHSWGTIVVCLIVSVSFIESVTFVLVKFLWWYWYLFLLLRSFQRPIQMPV